MERLCSLSESEERWKTLLELPHFSNNNDPKPKSRQQEEEEDPFDCSSVAVHPTLTLVEEVLEEKMKRWKELDERKVVRQEEENKGGGEKKQKGGWRFVDGRLRLPPNFDYATTRSEPPSDVEEDGGGDRVISLVDPSKQLSYHQELWKLFASVPTANEIEQKARSNAKLDHTVKVVTDEITEKYLAFKLDAHGLSRLRMADRHGIPPPKDWKPTDATIRLECWRRQPRRGSSPDHDRMVLEFLGSQTLLDVHSALVQLAEDDLWEEIRSQGSRQQQKEEQDGQGIDSGCFFIEGTFYTVGSVDYAGPILEWIDGGNLSKPNSARRSYLGIRTDQRLNTQNMREARLRDLSFRLGIRYVHVCHGDVETAVVFTDRRLTKKQRLLPYPLIHDVWTSQHALVLCDACRRFPVMYVTSASCQTTSGCKSLCEGCTNQLRLPTESITLYTIWKNQTDLSKGVVETHKKYF